MSEKIESSSIEASIARFVSNISGSGMNEFETRQLGELNGFKFEIYRSTDWTAGRRELESLDFLTIGNKDGTIIRISEFGGYEVRGSHTDVTPALEAAEEFFGVSAKKDTSAASSDVPAITEGVRNSVEDWL